MTIDRIDWYEENVDDSITGYDRLEIAGAHIGYYMEWAYKNGFAPNNPETHAVAEYQKVAKSEINGIQFLIENCDTKFWDTDLNEEGLKFTTGVYKTYLKNLEKILGHKPFTKKYNQEDFKKVSNFLDKIYVYYNNKTKK